MHEYENVNNSTKRFIENIEFDNNQERAHNPGSKTEDHDANNSRSILELEPHRLTR